MMNIIDVKDKLPENNTYVLAHYNGGNWFDPDDQLGCEWQVCKFVRGLSLADRELLPDIDSRKCCYRSGDEAFNNQRAYIWDTFGPGSHFGQDIDYWAPLPIAKEYRRAE